MHSSRMQWPSGGVGGGVCWGGGVSTPVHAGTHPPVNRMTDTCENISYCLQIQFYEFITSNHGSFGCPIITKNYYSQCYFVDRHLNIA